MATENEKRFKCSTCERIFFDIKLLRTCQSQHRKLLNKLINLFHSKFCMMNSYSGHQNASCGFYDSPRNLHSRGRWREKAKKAAEFARGYGIPPEKIVEFFENF